MNIQDRQIIQEAINRLTETVINEFMLDEKKKKKKKSKKSASNKDSKAATRRARVIRWLKDPSVNCAEIIRQLWKPTEKEEDAARSYFYKCRDGELNDSGVPYSFSDKEINILYSIKNNTI